MKKIIQEVALKGLTALETICIYLYFKNKAKVPAQ